MTPPKPQLKPYNKANDLSVFSHVVVTLTAYLFIDAGISQLVKAVAHFALDHPRGLELSILNLLFIPLGIGLIKRRRQPRGWAVFLMAAAAILLFLVTVVSVFEHRVPESISIEYSSYFGSIIAIICCAIAWRELSRHSEYFDDSSFQIPDQKRNSVMIWSLICLSVAINTMSLLDASQYEKKLATVFPVDVKIYVYDDETRLPLDQITSKTGPRSSTDPSYDHQIGTSIGRDTLPDGSNTSYARFSGIAFGTHSFEIGSEGYEFQKVMVSKNTKSEIMVYLKRTPQSEE